MARQISKEAKKNNKTVLGKFPQGFGRAVAVA
jgi:hypothetical protein